MASRIQCRAGAGRFVTEGSVFITERGGKKMDTPVATIEQSWNRDSRFRGVTRPYQAADVHRLRGSITIEHTLARLGAERLWKLLESEEYVPALGALTGNQAIQQVQAGLQAIYVSGWQCAGDANGAGQMYPDQS